MTGADGQPSRFRRRALRVTGTLALLLAVAFWLRRWVILGVLALVISPELAEPSDEGDAVRWFDDYYTIERIDPETVAIGEPRFSQQNYSYLILGSERGVLFDSGPGVRDIRPVVAALTELPITAIPSHLHYDHTSAYEHFERIAVVDLSYLRERAERAEDGMLRPTVGEHLGFLERIPRPAFRVSEWLPPGADVELGDRTLRVVHTPGHTPESISLHDAERSQLFTGDYINHGVLAAMLPGSSLGDYARTADALVAGIPAGTTLYTAHRMTPPGAPLMATSDLVDLRETLRAIERGDAPRCWVFPCIFRVNDHLEIYTDLPWTERWE